MRAVLADSSIWIDHLRSPDPRLIDFGRSKRLRTHPFVVGEIALGSLADRAAMLAALRLLRGVAVAEHDEVMAFVERERLFGRGIGYVDAHLLASCRLSPASLWTRDKRLHAAAERLGVAARVAN